MGTPALAKMGAVTRVGPLYEPLTTPATWSFSISLLAIATASWGLRRSSYTISSTFLPMIPPAALTSFTANSTDCLALAPSAATGPVMRGEEADLDGLLGGGRSRQEESDRGQGK